MNKYIFFLALLTASPNIYSSDDFVTVEPGYLSGSDWLSLSEKNRSLYTAGVIDGLKFSPVFAKDQEKTSKLINCTLPMTSRQIRAIAENYVNARPEKWHEPVHFMIFASIIEVCGVFKK